MRNYGHPSSDQFPELVQFKSCTAKVYRVRQVISVWADCAIMRLIEKHEDSPSATCDLRFVHRPPG